MNALEIVRHRRSVRTFDGNAVSGEDLARLNEKIASLTTPYDIPMEFLLLDPKENKKLTSPVLVGVPLYVAGKVKQVPYAEEAFGYAFEDLLLYADSIGLGNVWIAGTMDRASFEKACALEEGERMPCMSPLGYTAPKMSIREGLMRKGVGADTRLPFTELFFEDSFDRPLTAEAAGELSDLLEAVRWAPSAVNKQPWRAVVCREETSDGEKSLTMVHFYEKKTKGYVDPTGWDLQKIDLGIGMYHFVFAAEAAGLTPEFRISDPGLELPADTTYIASFKL